MCTTVFRPQEFKRATSKALSKNNKHVDYNFRNRTNFKFKEFKLNHYVIFRIFQRLHYLACHSPEPVRLKYKHAYDSFHKKYFGDTNRTSVRFANTHTAHRWL